MPACRAPVSDHRTPSSACWAGAGQTWFQWVALLSRVRPRAPHASPPALAMGEAAPVSGCGSSRFFSSAGEGLESEQRQHPLCLQCHCVQEYEPVWAWVMGKISCLPPFLHCGAAIQSLRLRHVLISQDRDALQGTGKYPTHFSLMLCLSLPSLRKG